MSKHLLRAVTLIAISMIWFASIGPSVGQGTPTPTASPTLPVISLSNADKLGIVGLVGRGTAQAIAWSGDGHHLAVASSTGLWWYDMRDPALAPQRLGDSTCCRLASSADGTILAWPSDRRVSIWNTTAGRLEKTIDVGLKSEATAITGVMVSADGSVVAANDTYSTLYIRHIRAGLDFEVPARLPLSTVIGTPWVALSPDGSLLAIADNATDFSLVRTDSPDLTPVDLGQPEGVADSVSFRQDGGQIAVGLANGQIWVGDALEHSTWLVLDSLNSRTTFLAFHPTRPWLVSVYADERVVLWNLTSGRRLRTFYAPDRPITSIQFSPDGDLLLVGNGYTDSRLWDVTTRHLQAILADATQAAFRPDGQVIAALYRGSVALWDTSTGRRTTLLPGYNASFVDWSVNGYGELLASPATAWTLSADGALLAAADQEGQVWVRSTDNGDERFYLDVSPAEADAVVFGSQSDILITGANDGRIRLWNMTSGQTRHTFQAGGRINALALSSNAQYLAAASTGGLQLWDLTSGQSRTLGPGSYLQVDFTPDGTLLAALTEKGEGQLWEVQTRHVRETLPVYVPHMVPGFMTNGMAYLAFTPDGRTLAYTKDASTIGLRDVSTGREYPHSVQCNGYILSIAFSADGQLIASACYEGFYYGRLEQFAATGAEKIGESGAYFSVPNRRSISQMLFSPDGKRLFVSCESGIWFWGIVP